MISAKKIREGQRKIEIMGNNLEIIEDLISLIDTVTKTVFKDSDRDRREFLKDIPYLISETKPTMATIKLPCSLDDLKKFGGDKNNG